MRALVILTFLIVSGNVYSQSSTNRFLDSTLTQLKAESKVDKADLSMFSLFETIYQEVLQSDKGELSPATAQRINAYATDSKTNNRHLLILFLLYQEHITQTAAQGLKPDVDYQLSCINLLQSEMKTVYNKVPTIVYIYQAEALKGAGRKDEAKALIAASLKEYPSSIPLKVYRFLDSGDENIKKDLVKNHSGHWMVQQFGIK